MSNKRANATASIDGIDGTIKFSHYAGGAELIHIQIQDKNGRVCEATVNRGQLEKAFMVVRHA